jgi:hypothetical protein
MIPQYTKSVAHLQELFQELSDEGKITPDQAERFDASQKVLVNFHEWTRNQLEGNFKVELPWEDPKFTEAWKLWTAYKKQQFNFRYKPIGEQSALQHLAELSGGFMDTAIAILKQSRDNGWAGLFELKQPKPAKANNEPRNVDYKQNLFNRLTQQQ